MTTKDIKILDKTENQIQSSFFIILRSWNFCAQATESLRHFAFLNVITKGLPSSLQIGLEFQPTISRPVDPSIDFKPRGIRRLVGPNLEVVMHFICRYSIDVAIRIAYGATHTHTTDFQLCKKL